MAASPKIRPPFAWLGRYAVLASVLSSVAIAAFFRFFRLDTLPPGIHTTSANLGLQAVALIDHGTLPGLDSINGYAPLLTWLQASAIKLFGHTELALRLWPALLGTLAVLATWAWVRQWFGARIAWLASFLLAITPWAVTLSRSGLESAAFPLLTSLTLYAATVAWRRRTLAAGLGLSAVFLLDLLCGPIGWLIVLLLITIALGLSIKQKTLLRLDRARVMLLAGLAVGLGVLGYFIGTSLTAVKALPGVAGLPSSLQVLGSNIVQTLLMFNVQGDENSRHNLSGEPLLNAFVGLMFVAGILVSISRLHQRRYRLLFVLVIVLLLPALATTVGVPNAARAAVTLPLILTLAAVGISYMLELWYRTFPINSAARSTGQAAIIVLLALSLFQGYTQYFRAWANSSEVYAAYNEGAVRIAQTLHDTGTADQKSGKSVTRYVVGSADELPVVAYLDAAKVGYTALAPGDIAGLPITPGTRRFIISASAKKVAADNLKLKFPGGTLRPLISDFNQAEICYIYEVTK